MTLTHTSHHIQIHIKVNRCPKHTANKRLEENLCGLGFKGFLDMKPKS